MRAKKLLSAITALSMLPTVGALSLPVTVSAASSGTVVRLDPSEASPWDFEGWGTSMGWWGNRIGYSDTLAQQAAKLFYSEEGLGLDIVRYNVGGGDDPTHNHITRSDSKLPCFAVPEYNEDGTLKRNENGDVVYSYNWDNDYNQVNTLKEIKKQNPDVHIEGYTNSPPWFMTISGCSSGGIDAAENLDPENYDNFAVFLADVTEHMKGIGLTFDSYSPMNEPNPATKYWGAYSPKQEGNLVAQGEHQSGMITALKSEYTKRGITTLVAGMDETSIDYSVNSYNQLTDAAKAALDRIDTHTYSGSNRAGLKATAIAADKPLWMSEVDGGWNGFGLADRIILDMNGMQPGAWVMWDIVDFHKDSAFQAPDGSYTEAAASLNPTATLWGVAMANHDTQEIELSNKYYAYGQFTKYINPGDTIIASSGSTLAAYNKTTGDIKIVVSNSSSADKAYTFDLSAFTRVGGKVTEIRSNNLTGSAAEHWTEIPNEAELAGSTLTTTAKAATITTYIIEDKTETALTAFSADADGLSYSYTISDDIENSDSYLAVYDSDNTLKYVSRNKTAAAVNGDFTGCTPKLMVWDTSQKPVTDVITTVSDPDGNKTVDYGVISGGTDELELNSVTELTFNTSLSGGVTWSVSDEKVASIDSDGTLTTKNLGTVTVYAEVDGYTFSRTYNVPFTGTIKGIGTELKCGVSAALSLEANITGDVKWSVSDTTVASITEDGIITGNNPGNVTIYASIGDYTIEKTITVQLYTVTGTASWGNDSTRPADSADYLKAIDGDLSTYFDGTQNGWVQYDYGAPFKATAVKLAARSGNGMPERTVGGTVQASSDGITWIDLYKITSAIPSDNYTTIDAAQLADNHAYRYYRYTNSDNMANIAEFILDGEISDDIPSDAPTVKDIDEFTDNFESISNIFNADNGALDSDGNKVFASGLDRYGNVFSPVKDTAAAVLTAPIELTNKDLFRMTFTMFAGWENNGKDNTFSVKDKDGNEIAALYMTGGGYNFNQIRIGGTNVLSAPTISQSRSNPGTSKAGANGWNASGQPFVNTVGYNKTVEIIIDGIGNVSISATGGMEDTVVTGTLTAPVSIGSIELTGDYNTSRERVVSYDNLDADIISYSTEFEKPVQTEAPLMPENGALISLNFDNGDLTSSSSYGKASGTPQFVTEDDKQCVQLDGTRATAITLTDANGNSLLTGQKNITISFKVKPTTTNTSWWFFAAPNANAQTYQQEQYLGAMTNGGTLTVERYNNSGARSTAATGAYTENAWNDVMISVNDGETTVYINGTETSTIASTVNIADMLGTASVAYIGLANWGSGEYAAGYLDDFE
ncbi:MAG: glycoside hydrolase, partial [Candidatus Ornithomonoglobus sp.]